MTLREMMTEEIANCGWLDYAYELGKKRGNISANTDYRTWLNSLDDRRFIASYKRVYDAGNRVQA